MASLNLKSGLPVNIDPENVRQVLGNHRAFVYLVGGTILELSQSRKNALDMLTAPKAKRPEARNKNRGPYVPRDK